ncbi:hypothetical protein ACU6MQ_001671 [Salmonella enterica subsp. enterica serovar Newport]
MKRVNLKDIISVSNDKSSPLWDEVTTLQFSTSVMSIPRPVMIGLGVFVLECDRRSAGTHILTYGGYEFVVESELNKHCSEGIIGLWKYLIDAGLSDMSKVCSHDYGKLEHFVRRNGERVPVTIDGYQTKMVTAPYSAEGIRATLYIRQTLVRDDLLDEAEQTLHGRVVNLAPSYDAQRMVQ